MNDKEIQKNINQELSNFAFNGNSISYEYLVEAIYIVIKNGLNAKNLKYNVYEPIAMKHHTEIDNVQWCLNKLISLMCINTSQIIIRSYFKSFTYKNISTKTFIMQVARIVRKNLIFGRPEAIDINSSAKPVKVVKFKHKKKLTFV